ncbi:hypothetical protein KKE60_07385 [Patescibacteria group bacterium]|nr:hypothetical protein [Patescibacteria group bacterium]
MKMHEARIDKQSEKAFLATPLNFKYSKDLWIPKSQIDDVFMVKGWLQKQMGLDLPLHLVLPAGKKEEDIPGIHAQNGDHNEEGRGATVTDDNYDELDKEIEEEFGADVDELGDLDNISEEEEEDDGDKSEELKDKKREPTENQDIEAEELCTVKILKANIPTFMGIDGKIYTVKKGEIVTLPKTNAKLLCKRGVAEAYDPKEEKTERSIDDILGDDPEDEKEESKDEHKKDDRWGERAEKEIDKIKAEQGKTEEKGGDKEEEEDKNIVTINIDPELSKQIEKIATVHEYCMSRARKSIKHVFPDVELTKIEELDRAKEIGTTLMIQIRFANR